MSTNFSVFPPLGANPRSIFSGTRMLTGATKFLRRLTLEADPQRIAVFTSATCLEVPQTQRGSGKFCRRRLSLNYRVRFFFQTLKFSWFGGNPFNVQIIVVFVDDEEDCSRQSFIATVGLHLASVFSIPVFDS